MAVIKKCSEQHKKIIGLVHLGWKTTIMYDYFDPSFSFEKRNFTGFTHGEQ